MSRPYTVIGFTLFFVTALLFRFEIGVTVTALAVFTVALVVCLFIRNVRKNGLLPTVFASGAVACILLICETMFIYNPALEFDGKNNCEIKAELIGLPEIRYGNYYCTAKAFSVNGEEADVKIRLVFSSPPEAEPYDIIEGKFNIFALGASDEELQQSYKAQGIFLGAYPSDESYLITEIAESEKPFAKKIIDLREEIKHAVYRIMPDEKGALAVALIIGDKSALPEEIYSDFRAVGISHIICVSGFHLSLWSMLILKILKKTRINFRAANLLAGVAVVVFMLVAGLTYSVVRAGIMMLVCLLGNILMRQRDSLNSLGFALAVLALIRPYSMGSVSLQLSALATAGIILYSMIVEPEINGIIDKISSKKFAENLKRLVSVFMITVSATAFTLPVSFSLGSSFNFLVFAANLVAVPVAGWCMISSAAAAAFGAALPMLFNLPAVAAKVLCRLLIGFTDWMAGFDFLTFTVSRDKTMYILCGIFLLCIAAVFISVFGKLVYTAAAAVCAVMFTVCIVTFSTSEAKETKITVVDCGNGMSVVVSSGGENVLIGGGGTDFLGASKINNVLEGAGGGLDSVFVPLDEEKSSAYIVDVFATYRPSEIYSCALPEGAELLVSKSCKHSLTETYYTENIFVKSFNIENNYCVYIKTQDISAVVCFDPSFDYGLLPEMIRDADVVISRGNFPAQTLQYTDSVYVLSAEEARAGYASVVYGDMGKRFVATGGAGSVVLRAENGAVSAERE